MKCAAVCDHGSYFAQFHVRVLRQPLVALPIPLAAEVVVAIRGDLFFRHDQAAGGLEVGGGLLAAEGVEVGVEFGFDLREVVLVDRRGAGHRGRSRRFRL